MIDILESYKQYVPSKPVELEEPIPGTESMEDRSYVTTLLGGDYLSVARARGAQYIRSSAELESERLNGLFPVCEDWHAKVCFLQVCLLFLLTPINHIMSTRQQCNIHTTIVARVWHAVCYLNSIYYIILLNFMSGFLEAALQD